MLFKTCLNGDVNLDLWLRLLSESNYTTPFQTPEFYRFFNDVQGLKADVFSVECNGNYTALCVVTLQREKGIKGYFSSRAIVYGGLVLSPTVSEEEIKYLLSFIKDNYKGIVIYIEVRNYFDYSHCKNLFFKNGFSYIPWLNYQLTTDSLDNVKARVSKSRLRQIKNAQKQGVVWRLAETEEEITAFYTILEDLYKTKIKKPLFQKEFFLRFFHSNVAKYLLVFYNQKVIGGIMCPILQDKSIYEFYVCGLDADYKDQYPSIMATWAAIEFAVQNKISLFDFMGAGSPNEAYGVREFKARFGGEQVEYGRFLFVLNPFLFTLGKIGLKTLSIFK